MFLQARKLPQTRLPSGVVSFCQKEQMTGFHDPNSTKNDSHFMRHHTTSRFYDKKLDSFTNFLHYALKF